jgi:hypothetical protein
MWSELELDTAPITGVKHIAVTVLFKRHKSIPSLRSVERFPKANSRAFSISIEEDDTCIFKRFAHLLHTAVAGIIAGLETVYSVDAHTRFLSKLLRTPAKGDAGHAGLNWSHVGFFSP